MKQTILITLALACLLGIRHAHAKDILFVATNKDFLNHFMVVGDHSTNSSECMNLNGGELEIYYGNLSLRKMQRLPLQLVRAHDAFDFLGLDFEMPFGSDLQVSLICDSKHWRVEVRHEDAAPVFFLENTADTAIAAYFNSSLLKEANHPATIYGIYSDLESYNRFHAVTFDPFSDGHTRYRLYTGYAEHMTEIPLRNVSIFHHSQSSGPSAVVLETIEHEVYTLPLPGMSFSLAAHYTDARKLKHILKRLHLSRELIDTLELDNVTTTFNDAGLCHDLFRK